MANTGDAAVPAENADLVRALETVEQELDLANKAQHVERLTVTAAILSEALGRAGFTTMLVGGGALEFYVPSNYSTSDVDLVVEGASGSPIRERIAEVFAALGFAKLKGRHWERAGILVEVPGHHIDDPFIDRRVGPYHLRIVRPEVLLVEREVEFDQTGDTGHAAQAIVLLATLAKSLDSALLEQLVQRERVADVHRELGTLAASGAKVTDPLLRDLRDRLHGRGRYASGYIPPDEGDPSDTGGATMGS